MNNVLIRYAQISDYEGVEEIYKQVHNLHINFRPDIYKQVNTVLKFQEYKQEINKNTIIIAEINNKLIGILSYQIKHIESEKQVTRNVIFIDCIAVDNNYRNKGIGKKLFQFVKEIVNRKDFDGLELQVNAKNKDAKKIYEKYGFVEKSINMEIT